MPSTLAERGARLLAATIDELILLAISLPMAIGSVPAVAALVAGATDLESLGTMDVMRTMVGGPGTTTTVLALLAWCVITAWLVAANGQSIGKRIVGIKVVRTDGSRASFARILLLRNVVNGLPNLLPYVGLGLPSLLFFVALLYQLIDPLLIYQDSRQCLHDRLADTMVVRA